ncbi:MAG: hypothetical protein IJ514_06105 [Clostridia bacterium]|nr:hypothetical protein [Clostridia bacterium]
MKEKKYYLGVDGGGTKTEFVLTDESGTVLRRLLKKGSNPNDIGLDACAALLREGISQTINGYSAANTYVFAGISGAGVGDNAKILRDRLAEEYPLIEVGSDLINALEVSLRGKDGVAVICGTGISCSICEDGIRRTVGGYGYLFEDGGSGYAYGRDAVKAALRFEDGIGEETVLTAYFREIYENGVKAALGEILLGGKALVASFCPLVFKGYEAKDAACAAIVQDNLSYTVQLIRSALKLRVGKGKRIAFVGGVTNETIFRETMVAEFGRTHELAFSTHKPIYGAVRKAVALAGGSADGRFEENFEKTVKGTKLC